MDNPAVDSLMEMVRRINQIAQKARSGEPGVEDYLQAVASDPVTEWFTELLREKSAELQAERDRMDRLAASLRTWHRARPATNSDASADEAELQLLEVLQVMGILDRQ